MVRGMTGKKRATLPVGRLGEGLAEEYLLGLGFEILERNYRKGFGELDFVARDRGTLVFIEVKTRHAGPFGGPMEAVDRRKQRQLSKMAQTFLVSRKIQDAPARFDVIGVILGDGNRLVRIEHIRNAFDYIE